MDNLKPTTNSVVAKSNDLIGKLARFDLQELRLLAYCTAHYDSRKPENRAFTAHVKDLCEIFQMDEKSAYDVVRRTMLNINSKPLEFKEGNRRCMRFWFSALDYLEGEGVFEFTVTPEIAPYLLGLKDKFTMYRLGDVYQFKAASTWKMYENLKRWEARGCWTIEVDELKHLLGVAGKYARWVNFQARMVDAPLKEINAVSDLQVTYEKARRGRKIHSLTFRIKSKAPEGTIDIDTPKQALYEGLLKIGINGETALKYATDAEKFGAAKHAIKKLPELKERWEKKGRVGVLQAYILGALKDEIYQTKLPLKSQSNKTISQKNNSMALEAIACYKKHGSMCNTPTDSERCQVCKSIVQLQ